MKKNRILIIILSLILVLQGVVLYSNDVAYADPEGSVTGGDSTGEVTEPSVPSEPEEQPQEPVEPNPPPSDPEIPSDDPIVIPPVDDEGGTIPPSEEGNGGDGSVSPSPDIPVVVPGVSGTSEGGTTSSANQATQQQKDIDTRLSELTIACGNLIPQFSPDVYEYTVYVTKEQANKSCSVSAKPIENEAVITEDGPSEFSDKDITKKIISTAPNGKKSEYSIKIHVLKKTELLINTTLYELSKRPEINLLPQGFKKTTIKKDDEKITVAQSSGKTLLVAQFFNKDDKKDYLWRIYNKDSGAFLETQIVDINGSKYVFVSQEDSLVYGVGQAGPGYYKYNEDDATLEIVELEPIDQVEKEPTFNKNIIIMALAALLLIAIGILGLKHLNRKKAKKTSEVKSKYFRPYIVIREEDIKDGDVKDGK